jgi:hypothetical protein
MNGQQLLIAARDAADPASSHEHGIGRTPAELEGVGYAEYA